MLKTLHSFYPGVTKRVATVLGMPQTPLTFSDGIWYWEHSEPEPGFFKVAPPGPYEDWVGAWSQFTPVGQQNAVVQVLIPASRTLQQAYVSLDGAPGLAWSTINSGLFPVGIIQAGAIQNSSYTLLNVTGPSLYLAFTMLNVPGGLAGHYIDCLVTLDDSSTIAGTLTY